MPATKKIICALTQPPAHPLPELKLFLYQVSNFRERVSCHDFTATAKDE